MILHPGDDGYDPILSYYWHENFPVKFNYQGYEWMKAVDDDGIYFVQMHALESFSGIGHEDRPFKPV